MWLTYEWWMISLAVRSCPWILGSIPLVSRQCLKVSVQFSRLLAKVDKPGTEAGDYFMVIAWEQAPWLPSWQLALLASSQAVLLCCGQRGRCIPFFQDQWYMHALLVICHIYGNIVAPRGLKRYVLRCFPVLPVVSKALLCCHYHTYRIHPWIPSQPVLVSCRLGLELCIDSKIKSLLTHRSLS